MSIDAYRRLRLHSPSSPPQHPHPDLPSVSPHPPPESLRWCSLHSLAGWPERPEKHQRSLSEHTPWSHRCSLSVDDATLKRPPASSSVPAPCTPSAAPSPAAPPRSYQRLGIGRSGGDEGCADRDVDPAAQCGGCLWNRGVGESQGECAGLPGLCQRHLILQHRKQQQCEGHPVAARHPLRHSLQRRRSLSSLHAPARSSSGVGCANVLHTHRIRTRWRPLR